MGRKHLCILLATGLVIAIYSCMVGYPSLLRGSVTKKATPTMSYILPPFKGNNSVHFLDVICVFPLLDTKGWSKAQYHHINRTMREERVKEYIYSLKGNLNHKAVATLHIFSHKPNQLFDKLTNQHGLDLTKAIFYNSTENPTYEEIFIYASRFLQGRFVLILNADNYMGDGFTEVDLGYMRTYKIMYSLTRRNLVPLPPNCDLGLPAYCEDNSSYIGSHDAFLFHLDFVFPNEFLKELRFPSNVLGSENVVIWAFQSILNYSVLNPCRILHIHHAHCSGVREVRNARVDGDRRHGRVGFTSSLYAKNAVKKQ